MVTISFINLSLILYSIIWECSCSTLHHGYGRLQYGYRLKGGIINSYTDYSILDCVEECLRTTRCKSMNYHRRAIFCEINYNSVASADKNRTSNSMAFTDRYIKSAGWIYIEKDGWNKELIGACSISRCPINTKCTQNTYGGLKCIISDCWIPEGVDSGKAEDSDAIGIHRQMTPSCSTGYKQMGSGLLTCQMDGKWTDNVKCGCEPGWMEYMTHCYFIGRTEVTWMEAKSECEAKRSSLVEIETKEESDWLAETFLFKDTCPSYLYEGCVAWTGGNDRILEGKYQWNNSNVTMTFTNWNADEPSTGVPNKAETRDCIDLLRNGRWNDRPCSHRGQFICEKSDGR